MKLISAIIVVSTLGASSSAAVVAETEKKTRRLRSSQNAYKSFNRILQPFEDGNTITIDGSSDPVFTLEGGEQEFGPVILQEPVAITEDGDNLPDDITIDGGEGMLGPVVDVMPTQEPQMGGTYCTWSPDTSCYVTGWPKCCEQKDCPPEQPPCEIEAVDPTLGLVADGSMSMSIPEEETATTTDPTTTTSTSTTTTTTTTTTFTTTTPTTTEDLPTTPDPTTTDLPTTTEAPDTTSTTEATTTTGTDATISPTPAPSTSEQTASPTDPVEVEDLPEEAVDPLEPQPSSATMTGSFMIAVFVSVTAGLVLV